MLRSQWGNLTVLYNLIQLKCPEREFEKLAVRLLAKLHYLSSAGRLTVKNCALRISSTVRQVASPCPLCMNT